MAVYCQLAFAFTYLVNMDVFPTDVPARDGPAPPIDAPSGPSDGGAASVDGAASPG